MSGYTYRAGRPLTPFEDNLLRRAKHAEDEAARAAMQAKHAEMQAKRAEADTRAAKTKLEHVGRMARKAADSDVRHVEALDAARDRTRGLLATLRQERTAARPVALVTHLTRELAKSEEVRLAAQEALRYERESHTEALADANRRAALAVEAQAHLAARLDEALQDQEDAWPGILEQAHEQQRKVRAALQARLDEAEARARSLEEQAEEQAASWRNHLRESLEEQAASWRSFLRESLKEQAERQAEEQAKEREELQARLDESEARVRSLEAQAAEREDLLDDAEARVRSLEVKTEYTKASDTRTYGHLVELEARVRELAGALDDALIIARDATAERDQARAKAVEHENAALQARQQAATAAAERDRAERAARQRDEDVWETQRMICRLGQAKGCKPGASADLPPHSGDVIVAPAGTSLEDMDRAMREHLASKRAKGFKPGGVIGADTEDDSQNGEQQQ